MGSIAALTSSLMLRSVSHASPPRVSLTGGRSPPSHSPLYLRQKSNQAAGVAAGGPVGASKSSAGGASAACFSPAAQGSEPKTRTNAPIISLRNTRFPAAQLLFFYL